MAKIKISGLNDLVEIANYVAIPLRDRFSQGQIRPEEIFNVANISFKGKDLKAVITDEEPAEEANLEKYRQFYENRRQFLNLSSKEKAGKNSWGHFKLFYSAVNNQLPKEEIKLKVIQSAEQFYEENPEWICVSLKHWQKFLNLPSNYKIENHAFRVLERIEIQNLDDIRKDKIFRDNQAKIKAAYMDDLVKYEQVKDREPEEERFDKDFKKLF